VVVTQQRRSVALSNPTPPCVVCGTPSVPYGSKAGYDLFHCSACLHLFVWPMPANVDFIYGEDYFTGAKAGFGYTDYDRDKQAMAPTFHAYLNRIEKVLGGTGTLLDVGAATGFFLDLARSRKWEVHGIEVSVSAATTARSKGLDVLTGPVESCDSPPGSFDAVCMWDVIEHMPNPCAAVTHVRQLLKPGGILAVNTPDSDSLLPRLLGVKWHLIIPPEHLNLFSRRSLRILLERHGFEILDLTRVGKTFTLQYTAQFALKTLGLLDGPAGRISRALNGTWMGRWRIPINLRDNVFTLARAR